MKLFKSRPSDASEIRGVSDENLKFVHTSNLWLIAMARLMESEGVDDQPLIDELYRRGRNGFEKNGGEMSEFSTAGIRAVMHDLEQQIVKEKARADKAEAACAEMRQLFRYFHRNPTLAVYKNKIDLVLNGSFGKGWLSPEKTKALKDAAEMLWTVVANVSNGDWSKQSEEWQIAAARWRDAYFAALKEDA